MAGVNELREQRNRVLLAVYELTEGNPLKSVVAADVAAQTAMAEEVAETAVRWLVDREFLSIESLAGDVTVTPEGSDEAERLLTEGVDPAAVVLTIRERQVLEAFTREVRQVLEVAALDPDARADADAQLATIEAQQRSPRPRRAVIGFALRALNAAAGAAVAGVLGNAAYAGLHALMS